MWEKVVKKDIDVEVKASLQLPSRTGEINFKCLKDYKPLAKKDKDKPNWEHLNKNKVKFHNPSSANTSQSQT